MSGVEEPREPTVLATEEVAQAGGSPGPTADTASHEAVPDPTPATEPGAAAAPAAARAEEPGAKGPGGEEPGAEEPAEVDPARLAEQLAVVQRERDEYLDALRRLQADFENYRKRIQRQQEDVILRAMERLVAAMLPALDAFELAEEHLVGDEAVSPGGLLQAVALLRDTLAKEGLERIGAVGDAFDPTAHEAVEHAPDGDGQGPVVEVVLRPGYRFQGRMVRPAMVKVRG
ncbi:nucleotide exchange factor GrpE [Aciditerrimonas ferrireducens]|uniref:Protein GrpE n=1 Tax=Aciditerrimonas ferrireducens TaxID=667306 RepID=A0ABV6BYM4_9ACTN